MTFFKWCEDTISKITSRQWWKETAWAKIKHNAIDVGMMIFFEVASVVMSVSANFLSITISTEVAEALTCVLASSSIFASLLADWQHTGEKRGAFDKLITQVIFVGGQPTKPTEFSRRFGFTLSVIGVFGYVGCFVLGLPPAAEWTCISFGVLSCHIGRKYYDMKLGAGLAVMEAESDKILDISGLKNSDMAREQIERIKLLDARCATLADKVARLEEERRTSTQVELLSDLEPSRVVIQRTPSSTAQMSAVGLMDDATIGESSESPHVLSQLTHEAREDDSERHVP